MPTPSFSKDITALFNDSELRDDLKYDITCRFVCESLKVSTVSMLMYDAKLDKLVCSGKYLARKSRSNYEAEEKISIIIDNICVFEFFDANSDDFIDLSLDDFLSSVINGETNKNYEISRKDFDLLKSNWELNSYRELYYRYKKDLHSEIHEIDHSTISSKFFSKLLAFGKKLTSEVEISLMTSGPKKGKNFFEAWQLQNIRFPSEDLYYIGLPIFATERYSGILRITVTKNADSNVEDIFGSSNQLYFQSEQLNNFAQLISLHLKTNYYLQGYRALSNLKIGEINSSESSTKDCDEICNILVNVIKCNRCILRLSLGLYDQNDPPIRGISKSEVDYKYYLSRRSSASFSEDIASILNKKNFKERDIKAVNFSILEGENDSKFDTIEYYYENEMLKYEKISSRLFRDFTNDYVQDLRNFGMMEIVVLRLEYNDHGYFILTNTRNRKFTSSDIEMVLLASKRIGLEIKHQQDRKRIREQNKIIAQEENARLIVHQIGAPVRALSGHAQNLDDKIFKEHEIPVKISQLNKMAYALLRQVNSIQKYLDWEVKDIVPKREQNRYSLERYFRSRAIQFEGLTVGRRLKIWTIIENINDFYDEANFDKSMLDEIINCLLDNAVKYSFSQNELFVNNIYFDPDDPYSNGHIHIILNSNPERVILTVENYGCHIDPNEYDRIFERGSRGKYGKKKSPVGSGIGLYLAKKVVLAFKGTIEVKHNKLNFLTQFKVTLKHEQ